MVLDHVPESARLLVIGATAFHPDGLGGGDLNMLDVAPVPERLEDSIAEAEREDVLDRFLAEVVIDAVDPALFKNFLQSPVQLDGAREIPAERFFDDDAPPAVAFREPRCADSFRDGRVLAGLGREVEERIPGGLA